MKIFLRKIAAFMLLYILFSCLISIVVPYHWGNPWFSSKIDYLESGDNNFNTYFFGSSLVYRHIDPEVFDNVCNSLSDDHVSTFNLGAPATFCPQTYYLYDKFLKSPLSKKTKVCFIELMEVDTLDKFFLHQERTTYWQNISDVIFVSKSVLNNPELDNDEKPGTIFRYITSYLENLFHVGHFGRQILTRDYYDEKFVGAAGNGFFPVELDLETTEDEEIRKHFIQRRKRFKLNAGKLKRRATLAAQYNRRISEQCDNVNLERINQLIAQSKEKGIYLVFLLSPRNASQELVNLINLIPRGHAIDMSHPGKWSQFYRVETSFDIGHLNRKGAIEYSTALAQEFIRLRERNNAVQ